jgi:hypothetical protein
VLFVFQVARRAPEYGFTKYQFNGGCGAVAQSIKSMQSMGFYALHDGAPQSPVGVAGCAQITKLLKKGLT